MACCNSSANSGRQIHGSCATLPVPTDQKAMSVRERSCSRSGSGDNRRLGAVSMQLKRSSPSCGRSPRTRAPTSRTPACTSLNVGFPLLSLPPGSVGSRQGGLTRRIIAPIAFIQYRSPSNKARRARSSCAAPARDRSRHAEHRSARLAGAADGSLGRRAFCG